MFQELKEEREKYAAQILSLQKARNESMIRSFYSLQPPESQSLVQFRSQAIAAEPTSYDINNSEVQIATNLNLLNKSTNDLEGANQGSSTNVANTLQNKAPYKISSAMPSTALTDSLSNELYSPTTYNIIRKEYKTCNNSSSISSHGTIDIPYHLAIPDKVTGLDNDEEINISSATHTPITRHVETVTRNIVKNNMSMHQIDYLQQQQQSKKTNKGTMTQGICLKSVAIQVEPKYKHTLCTSPKSIVQPQSLPTHKHLRKPSSTKEDSQRKLTVSAFVYPTRDQPDIEYKPGAISSLVHPAYSSSVLQSYTEIYKSLSNTSKAILGN